MKETHFSDNTNVVEIPHRDYREITKKITKMFKKDIPYIPTTVVWNKKLYISFSPASNYSSKPTSRSSEHSITKDLKFTDDTMNKQITYFVGRGMRLSAMYIHADNKQATCTFTSF